jgi:hypothetical protein
MMILLRKGVGSIGNNYLMLLREYLAEILHYETSLMGLRRAVGSVTRRFEEDTIVILNKHHFSLNNFAYSHNTRTFYAYSPMKTPDFLHK